ncbi:MAG: AzlD domain-containing protein [Corynebacterium sp.]|nr:AzlD domain-containing protein [Corynebacterium sp.]
MTNYGLPEGIGLGYFLAVLIAIGVVTVLLRAVPFVATRHMRNNFFLRFLGIYMPVGIMSILVIYTLLSTYRNHGHLLALYGVISLTVTLLLQHWRRNSLLSIFGGTILYMILCSFFA